MSPAVRAVLIVGGGPAGLALALALARIAISVELVEASPQLRAPGAALTLLGPALRALDALGLADPVVAAGAPRTRLLICDRDGVPGEEIVYPAAHRPGLPPAIGITRPALHATLSDAAAAVGVRPRLGVTPTALRSRPGEVVVDFSDGRCATYDLVVGADGIHSETRTRLFPDAELPRFTGQGVWHALVDRPPGRVDAGMHYGPRNKAGVNVVSDSEMYLYLVQSVASTERPARAEMPSLLRSQLADFGGVVAYARERIVDPARIDYRPLAALLLPPPWHRGRVVLIGDAAHAATPHLAAGAMCAIEDAVVLAELLRDDVPVPTLLRRFCERRYERCRLVVEGSLQLGEWEKDPSSADADPAGLTASAWTTLAEAI